MVFKLDIEPELLESMYWGNDYSDWQIAGIFGCSEGAINRRRKECGIISHINRELQILNLMIDKKRFLKVVCLVTVV